MIGPHYQKIAEVENKLNARQLLQKIQSRSQVNPLTQVIEKLKKQFSEYQTAYADEIIDHQIHSVDRLLSFDGKLGPILSGLQKQNNLLRKQLTVLENQLSNTVSICEQILTQNNSLKQIIKNKNIDLQKIIDTIALNQSEERGSLQDKISLLEQQNSILIRHLDEIRKEHQQYNEKFIIEKQKTQSWKLKFQQTKRHLSQLLQQEQQISRKLSLVQHNLYNQTQKVYSLQAELEAIKFQNNEIKNQLIILKNGQTLNNIESLKSKLQEQYAGIIQEHKNLKKQRTQLLKESQTYKIQKQQALQKIEHMQTIIIKLQKDLQLTQNLLTDQKQKNSSLQNNISRIQSRFDEIKSENNKLRLQVESTNNYTIHKQKILNRQIQQLRQELDKKSLDMEKSLKDLRQKTRVLMQTKQGQLKSLNDTNIQLRRLLERQQQGI